MGVAEFTQHSFTSGEISPRLKGRQDLARYATGVESQENWISQRHGPATRRPGTKFVAEVKDSTKFTRLVAFQYSTTQTYVLEFGHQYIRFYRDNGQLSFGGSPTEEATPYTEAQLLGLKFWQSADVLFICHPSHAPRTLKRTAGDDSDPATWTLALLDIRDGPYEDQPSETAITFSPSATSGSVTITASAAIFAATDVGRLLRLSNHASGEQWGWGEITAFTDSTHVTVNVRRNFAQAAVATSLWRLGEWNDSRGWPMCGVIHGGRMWFGGTMTAPHRVWSTMIGNYDPAVMRPTEVLGDVLPENAVTLAVDDDRVNVVHWLRSDAAGLVILTDGGIFIAKGGASDFDPIVADGVPSLRRHTAVGVNPYVAPVLVDNIIAFIDHRGRKVREFAYDLESDRFGARDLTTVSEHVTVTGIVDAAFQAEPDSVLWLVRTDGTLLGMTWDRAEQVIGWHRHVLGGSLSGADRPDIDSITVIREGGEDQVWLIVRRTINATTERYVEIMQPQFPVNGDIDDAFFVDSGLSLDNRKAIEGATQANPVVITITGHGYSNGDIIDIRDMRGMTELNANNGGAGYTAAGVAANTFQLSGVNGLAFGAFQLGGTAAKRVTSVSGLAHLNGQTVKVLGNGLAQADRTVSAGAITVTAASILHVGLGYTSTLKTLPINLVAGLLRDKRRIAKVLLRVHNACGGQVLRVGGTAYAITSTALVSDTIEHGIDVPSHFDAPFIVRVETPTPFTLLGFTASGTIGN